MSRLPRMIDTAMDRSVVWGFSAVGPAVRRRLPGWPDDPAPHALRGRQVAITGATSGLGLALAGQVADRGAAVHLVVRDPDRGAVVADQLAARTGRADAATVWRCDVSDADSVREFTDRFVEAGVRLWGLVHNAGALPDEWTASPQGHELTMALHVLGPVQMTEHLLSVFGPGGRVVLITSGGMYAQRLRADDPDYRDGEYAGTTAYARSKRAQVELLPILQDRWGRDGLRVWATHPGWADTPGVASSLPGFARITRPILRTAESGVDTTGWLLATEPPPPGGGLWHDRRERPVSYFSRTRSTAADRARLWRWVSDRLELGEERRG